MCYGVLVVAHVADLSVKNRIEVMESATKDKQTFDMPVVGTILFNDGINILYLLLRQIDHRELFWTAQMKYALQNIIYLSNLVPCNTKNFSKIYKEKSAQTFYISKLIINRYFFLTNAISLNDFTIFLTIC